MEELWMALVLAGIGLAISIAKSAKDILLASAQAYVRKINNEAVSTALQGVLNSLHTATYAVVDFVDQTFSDELRKNGGKLTAEQQKEAFHRALEGTKKVLGEQWAATAQEVLGKERVDEVISMFVESTVKSRKNFRPMELLHTSPSGTPLVTPSSTDDASTSQDQK